MRDQKAAGPAARGDWQGARENDRLGGTIDLEFNQPYLRWQVSHIAKHVAVTREHACLLAKHFYGEVQA